MPALPPCPVCRNNLRVSPHGREEYYCSRCGGIFDNDPDEGGTHYQDPSKRLEKQEERSQRRPRR